MATMRPKELSVNFVDNHEVQQITSETNKAGGIFIPLAQRGHNRQRNAYQSRGELQELSPIEELEDESRDVFSKPTELLKEEEGLVKGSIAFGFCTPKKHRVMLDKAGSALTPTGALRSSPATPRIPGHRITTPKTPKTPLTPKTPRTPKSGKKTPQGRRLSEIQEAPTPYSFRRRVQQRITKIVLDEDSSSSDDDGDSNYSKSDPEDDSSIYHGSDSDDDHSKENVCHLENKTVRTPSQTPSRPPSKTSKASHKTPSRVGQCGVGKMKDGTSGCTPSKTPSRSGCAKKIKDVEMIVLDKDSSSSDDDDDDDDDSDYSKSDPEDDSSIYHGSDSDDDHSKENVCHLENKTVRTPSQTPSRPPSKTSKASHKTPSRVGQCGVGKMKDGTSGCTPSKTPSRSGCAKKIKDVEMVAKSDDYFIVSHNEVRTRTSDHTLSRLSTPRLAPEILQSILSDMVTTHHKERQALRDDCSQSFARWMIYLCEGFSIFLYGLGSKKQLISEFQEQFLAECDHVVVNGFFPSLTLKSILNNIIQDILDHDSSFHSVQDQLDFLDTIYSNSTSSPLFLLIHNLDGAMLRGDKTQTALARLASFQNVHVLASFDHINAPLLLDSKKMSLYNAVWFDATTFEQYHEETSYENSLLVQQSSSLALSSLIHVFRSLTPNAKGIFMLLAKHQLDQKDNKNYNGMSFSDLYQRCRESFLVNSDLTLRAQLTEFRDHKLLRSRKGHDGVENLTIPLQPNTLQDFINQQELEDGA